MVRVAGGLHGGFDAIAAAMSLGLRPIETLHDQGRELRMVRQIDEGQKGSQVATTHTTVL